MDTRAVDVFRPRNEGSYPVRSEIRALSRRQTTRTNVTNPERLVWLFNSVTSDEGQRASEDWRARVGRLVVLDLSDGAGLDVFPERPSAQEGGILTLLGHGAVTEDELDLYKKEVRKQHSEQSDRDQKERERRRAAAAYLDEAIALAHPIAFQLLAWLHHAGSVELERTFKIFGPSSSTFEGIARLHFLGAVKFDERRVSITSLGNRILEKFGFSGSTNTEGPGASQEAT